MGIVNSCLIFYTVVIGCSGSTKTDAISSCLIVSIVIERSPFFRNISAIYAIPLLAIYSLYHHQPHCQPKQKRSQGMEIPATALLINYLTFKTKSID
jgi:hypothetical protein